jgi:hypothetical protein
MYLDEYLRIIFLRKLKMEELSDLIDKFWNSHNRAKVKYAVFTVPVINGDIYLAQRNTPPQMGLYSLIGGKVDPFTEQDPKIELPTSQGSAYLGGKGFERLKWTSLRELIEELYNRGEKLTGEDIKSLDLKRFRIYDHETLLDANTGVKCYTKVVEVPEEFSLSGRMIKGDKFNPSDREIGRINRLSVSHSYIPLVQINPLTKVALVLKPRVDDSPLSRYANQIPEIKCEQKRGFVGRVGNGFRFHADYKSDAAEFQGFYFDYDIEI